MATVYVFRWPDWQFDQTAQQSAQAGEIKGFFKWLYITADGSTYAEGQSPTITLSTSTTQAQFFQALEDEVDTWATQNGHTVSWRRGIYQS
jgi:hypothetical protein